MYKLCFNWLSNSATCITTPAQFWQQRWTPWPCPFDRRPAQFTCQMSQVHCLPWAERSVCHFWLCDEDGSVKILISQFVVGLRCGMQIIIIIIFVKCYSLTELSSLHCTNNLTKSLLTDISTNFTIHTIYTCWHTHNSLSQECMVCQCLWKGLTKEESPELGLKPRQNGYT